MLLGKVSGSVISTRKHHNLIGNKFLIVKLYQSKGDENPFLVAIDTVGAGVGDIVLITTGSGARLSIEHDNVPIDAAIVGIIDEENDNKLFDYN